MKQVIILFGNIKLTLKGCFVCMLFAFLGNIDCVAQESIFMEDYETGYPWFLIKSHDGQTVGAQNVDGKVIIPLSEGFESISYHRGFYIASYGTGTDSQHCLYTYDGILVIEKGKYDDFIVMECKSDWSWVPTKWYIKVTKDGKVGACDLSGKELVEPKFETLFYSSYREESFYYEDSDSINKYNYKSLHIALPSIKKPTPDIKASAKFSKVWINQIYEENKCYSDIYADLTVYGMKNKKALIQMKIRDSKGKWMKMEYARKSKDGSYYYETDFVPEYYGTSYNNKMWFLHLNKDLKLKKNKQYELILTIISTKNGDTLAVSSPYSFTAFPRNDPAARSTYTTRTYTPVQNPAYPISTSRNSSTRSQSRTASSNTTNSNTSYTSGSTNTSSSYSSRTSRATHSSRTSSQSKSEQSTKKKCQQCNGAGYKQCRTCDGTGKIKCTQCGGDGQVTSRYLNSHNKMATLNMKCTACNGKGKKNDLVCGGKGTKKCVSCNGKGYY